MSRQLFTLTDNSPSAVTVVKGYETFVFASGDFGGGKVVTQYSYNNTNWFSDKYLTFSAKGFETFRAAPTLSYRFIMIGATNPNVEVVVI